MTTTEVTVPATRGNPYTITHDDRDVVRIQRESADGRTVTVVFSRDDVIAVTNALHDVLEGDK